MRRASLILAVLAVGPGAGPAAGQEPPLQARVAACEVGREAVDRNAEFTASMPRDGAVGMAMRFDLLQRSLHGGSFTRVELARWGQWERATRAGAPGFVFTKRVEQLAEAAAYRAVVRFRWTDADGRTVRRARRVTASCRQPDWRADLHLERVVFTADRRASAVVVNRGRSATGPFDLTMTVRGQRSLTATAGLAVGERRTIELGRCPGGRARITLDPDDRVDEAREGDNRLTVRCPRRR